MMRTYQTVYTLACFYLVFCFKRPVILKHKPVNLFVTKESGDKNPTDEFLEALRSSFTDRTFVNLKTSGNILIGRNSSPVDILPKESTNIDLQTLKSVEGRLVRIKSGQKCQFTLRYLTNDQTKNLDVGDKSLEFVKDLIEQSGWFQSASLLTSTNRVDLNVRRGKVRIVKNPLQKQDREKIDNLANQDHDFKKNANISPDSPFLLKLKVTTEDGRPRVGMSDKYRQIQRFVELLDNTIRTSTLSKRQSAISSSGNDSKPPLTIVDMGSGLAYLTFAAHEHFSKTYEATTIGVEARPALVAQTQQIARDLGAPFSGLNFVQGMIGDVDVNTLLKDPLDRIDVLMALHACDTATDDAIWTGIQLGAEVIMTAPCCHKQVRPQLDRFSSAVSSSTRPSRLVNDELESTPQPNLTAEADGGGRTVGVRASSEMMLMQSVLQHGIYRERTAEMVTDTARALLLELAGYETTVLEFVDGEHTAKNIMIVGVKRPQRVGRAVFAAGDGEVDASELKLKPTRRKRVAPKSSRLTATDVTDPGSNSAAGTARWRMDGQDDYLGSELTDADFFSITSTRSLITSPLNSEDDVIDEVGPINSVSTDNTATVSTIVQGGKREDDEKAVQTRAHLADLLRSFGIKRLRLAELMGEEGVLSQSSVTPSSKTVLKLKPVKHTKKRRTKVDSEDVDVEWDWSKDFRPPSNV